MSAGNTIIALIRHTLGIRPFEGHIGETSAIVKMAQKHAILPLIAGALSENADCDEKQRLFLNRSRLVAVHRFEQQKLLYSRIEDVLGSIPHVLLKGGITAAYYPEPWMRTRSDIDVLVPQKDIGEAVKALQATELFGEPTYNYHDVAFIAKNGLALELHFSLLEKDARLDRVLGQAWDFVEKGKMSDEYFLFHQIAHTAYHFQNGGCGIRFLVDLWLLRQSLAVNEKILSDLLAQAELTAFYENLCKLNDYWFGGGEPNEIILQIESYLFDGALFGTLENKVAAEQGRSGGKLGYVFSRLFWSYEDLCAQYPSLEGKKYLLPFYHMRRLWRLTDKNARKNSASALRANGELSADKVRKMQNFLKNSGL